jgi:hypothetical protein
MSKPNKNDPLGMLAYSVSLATRSNEWRAELLMYSLAVCLDRLPDDEALPLYDRILSSWRNANSENKMIAMSIVLEPVLTLADPDYPKGLVACTMQVLLSHLSEDSRTKLFDRIRASWAKPDHKWMQWAADKLRRAHTLTVEQMRVARGIHMRG